jgi:hypothetical protein
MAKPFVDLPLMLLTIFGLALFESISSIDNAVINAEVLSKMSERARRWFLFYGIIIAVVVVRFMLPTAMLWIANPGLSPYDLTMAMFSGNGGVADAMEKGSPMLLTAGGVFLVFLFFHWLFLEPKRFGLAGERFFYDRGMWFYSVISVILLAITWFAINRDALMAFSAVAGSTAFFITHGFRQNAEAREREMMDSGQNPKAVGLSDLSKLLYLEVIDAAFSIDGVIGAFAFTFFIPLILIGNGLGAIIVRELTVRNIENVRKYVFLKNGAMYSILFLGTVMLLDAFGIAIPQYISPIVTFACIGFFFWKSRRELDGAKAASPA